MDMTQALVDQVKTAFDNDTTLAIHGGRSKDFLGAEFAGQSLDLSGHQGIVNYQPVELVMTVRAGTLLSDVNAALAEQGQSLPFEPPGFGPTATIGGTIATGVSGPARPYTGSARDYMLGVRMINGQGEHLRFGGEVMKNVAGYDISRVMTASHGTLGAITEVSLKVLPVAKAETTLMFQMSAADAVARFNALAGKPLPITATAWAAGVAYIRLSGAASAVDAAATELGGTVVDAPWHAMSELTHESVSEAPTLWRVSVPQVAPVQAMAGSEPSLLEWGGAQRWITSDVDPLQLRAEVKAMGGHATLYRGQGAPVFQPLDAGMAALHSRIKTSFDPKGLFNRGRFHPEF